ncbi:hypothetical protein [Micromonospora sp. RTGN7]|uniref:hypothetical protein n=1 Tax=Micromonospora sp. RTGN7 TaxID=3016526 RepID=UPI0029FEF09F|nr:hypothetical protein [Micromonospora sp. RTGN7]
MTEIQLLDTAAAASALTAVPGSARGFLGVDPVTQNHALLVRELTRLGAQVFRTGDTLLGYLPNEVQPRQAYVASTSPDPEPLRGFLDFLGTYQRCTSFVALVPADSPPVVALRDCGFTQVGTLREHRYQSGAYQDVSVYFVRGEDTCRS